MTGTWDRSIGKNEGGTGAGGLIDCHPLAGSSVWHGWEPTAPVCPTGEVEDSWGAGWWVPQATTGWGEGGWMDHGEDSSNQWCQNRCPKATKLGHPIYDCRRQCKKGACRAPGPLPPAWGCLSFLLPLAGISGRRKWRRETLKGKGTFRPKRLMWVITVTSIIFCNRPKQGSKIKWYMIIEN